MSKVMENSGLRSSCDRCCQKKRRCDGGVPTCLRCRRGSFVCSYSEKRKRGRPRGTITTLPALTSSFNSKTGVKSRTDTRQSRHELTSYRQQEGAHDERKSASRGREQLKQMINRGRGEGEAAGGGRGGEQERCRSEITVRRPSFCASSATGLAGLQESRFLSCFLENCAPICGFADACVVRDGLVHAWAGTLAANAPSSLADTSQGPLETKRSSALQSVVFSAMAIGGVMLGCPGEAVSRHVAAAREHKINFAGLREQPAASALVLYGFMNKLLPSCDQPAAENQQREYRSSMDEAQEIFQTLPYKDPFINAFLVFRESCDGLLRCGESSTRSTNPANMILGARGGMAKGAATASDADECRGSSEGGRPNASVAAARAMEANTKKRLDRVRAKAAHPAYVVTDATMLLLHYMREQGNVRSGLLNFHDFVSSELTRLIKLEVGAMGLTTLVGILIGVKTILSMTLCDTLAVAEMALSMFSKCPGLLRYNSLHNAHMMLAMFRRLDQRKSFDTLRALIFSSTQKEIPSFEEFVVGTRICDLCDQCSDAILAMPGSTGCTVGAEGVAGRVGDSATPGQPDDAREGGKTGDVSRDLHLERRK